MVKRTFHPPFCIYHKLTSKSEFYNTTLHETRALVANSPQEVPDMIYAVFSPYRVPDTAITPLVDSLTKDPVATVDFLMCFHHSLPAASSTKRTPFSSALTIAAGYFLGGFIPLLPYWFVDRDQVMMGLYWSVGVMSVCLFIFGVGRNIAVGEGTGGLLGRFRGGMEMVAIGGVAAAASWGIVKALGDGHN